MKTISDIGHTNALFSFACVCATLVFSSLLGLSRLQAATTADVVNAVTLGDTISITIDGHCLTATAEGTIAATDRNSISANALWRSVKDEQETNTDLRRYQNIATGNWLRVNTDNKTLSLVADKANSSVFTHSWTTAYNYSASGTATGSISWTNQQTTLSLAYSASAFTLSASASTITFEQWHYYKDAKDLTFTVALDQTHSPSVRVQTGIFEALFPFADWATRAERDTQMPYLGTAANNLLGYNEQYATFNINPTLRVSSYYASTAQKDKIITVQPATYTSAADIKAQGVSFALRWGCIKGDGIYSRIPAYNSYYNVIVNDNANGKTDLKDSKFDETFYRNYYDLGGREILKYEYNDQNPLTFTVKPIGRGPANVCQTENYGKIQNWQWGDYKDSLFVDAKGVMSSNGEQKVRIGRQSWNMWTEHWLFSQTTLNSTYGTQKDFDEKGGTMEFSVEKAELALGIGQHNPEDKKAGVNVFVSDIGGYIHFIENPNQRTDVKNDVTYKFTFSGNGESWVTPTVNGDKVSLTIAPLAEPGTRSTEMIFRIKYQFSDTKSYYTYDTITITQTSQSGKVEPTVFIPNRGKGYAVFKDGRQQVHTYETTLYYSKGEDITLDLKEPNMFGYMRWYDYNTGRDPQYYTEADGTVRTLANFWKLFPYGRKDFKITSSGGTTTTQPDVLFSSFNEGDAEHSKGVYFLIPEDYRNVRFGTGQLPSPIIHLDEDNLELDIACDVSNYTDYEQVTVLGHLQSFTEPTLSYRQIFHIRPAIEMKRTIADSLAKHTCKTKTYYEEYTYTVPVGTEVDLQTKYQLVRANGAKSDMHYWVKMADGTYDYTVAQTTGIPEGKYPWWYRWNGKKFEEQIWNQDDPFNVTGKGNYYNDGKGVNYDFFRVKYDEETTMQWAVWIVPGEGGTFGTRYTGDTIWLAHFTVTWSTNASGLTRDTTLYGPSAKPLITKEDILRDYIMLSEQNFDFDEPGTTETTLYPQPLPAEESTFGFVYPYSVIGNNVHRRNHSAQKPFADYGEYAIINRVGENENYGGGTTTATNFLLPTTQHTGTPADGYCLYVDGAKIAGKVVSLSTKAKLCSGQRMYCAMWLCNPTPSRSGGITNPDFRVDVEGRKDGGEWTVVESYEVGELNNGNATRTTGGLWRQIRFPLVSMQDFDESRITLYNYAATNNDNDFLVDDVWLYASRLPMEAFQTNTACVNDSKKGETMAAVIRMDYTKFEGKLNDKNELCYQVFDKTENKSLNLNYLNHKECTSSDCGNVKYYGSLTLPAKDPGPDDKTYTSLQEFLKAVTDNNSSEATNETDAPVGDKTHIGYVQITETIEGQADTRYILYIAEVLDASTMNPRHEYEVRAAYAPEDLANPQCAMRTPLPIFERTAFLFNGETYPAKGQCANERYPLEILVRKDIVDGDRSVTLSALARGEWLQGFDFDSIYYKAYVAGLKGPDPESDSVKAANAAFKEKYGYTRDEVWAAIADMRREPTEQRKTNFDVTDFHQLNSGSEYWDNQSHYAIIMDLCHRGLLRLAMEKEYFYLHSQDTVRYWIFPTARTAKVTYNGEEYTLNECATPTFVNVFTNESNYNLDLGVDRKHLQNGQVPRLRLTQSEANTCFSVPVTAIGEEVVLGWDSTQICFDGTTDPVILKKIEDHDALFSMRYTQDRIYTELADKTQYYKAGQMVKFTPIDEAHVKAMQKISDEQPDKYPGEGHPGFWKPNSDIMRAGYEYTLQLQMTTRKDDKLAVEDEQQGGCPLGYSYITLVVVPDTLIWTPTHYDTDGYYHWGEDENWRGYSNGEVSEVGYAPLASSMVIIPSGLEANQYPYIAKGENRYPADANYNSAVCRMVQFRRGAHVLGQENLTYEKAFVDMAFPSASWNTLSAPLQSMYSGDLFIPHSGKYSDEDAKRLEDNKKDKDYSQDFIVSGFQGMRTGSAAYAFWASYYNQNVNYQYTYGGDVVNSTTAAFVPSNALNEALLPGHGFAAAGWGLSDNETLEIRLPKTDVTYSYYDKQGKPTDNKVSLDRTNAGKLAYTPTLQEENTVQDGNTTAMQVTLTNAVAGGEFLLGNLTMAYLDVFKLLEANSDVLEKNHFRYIKNNTMETYSEVTTESDYALRFIEPMQSVLLTPKNKDVKELIIKIPRACLSMTTVKTAEAETPASAPRRAAGHTLNRQIMNIIAYNANGRAKATLAAIDFADNGYRADEDVIFISSGVEAGVGGNRATTPMNIYTLAGTQPLAVDIREKIGVVPLGFVIADNYRTDSITLYFGLNSTWESECYLCDNLTGTRRRIYNDSRIRIATPANHQLRYYIQGPQRKPTNPDTPTDINDTPVFDTHGTHVSAFSNAPLSAVVVATDNIVMVDAYDMAGRQLLHLLPDAAAPICNLSLPSGVALLRVALSTGLTAQTKVIVR